jgi:hypothetical protein
MGQQCYMCDCDTGTRMAAAASPWQRVLQWRKPCACVYAALSHMFDDDGFKSMPLITHKQRQCTMLSCIRGPLIACIASPSARNPPSTGPICKHDSRSKQSDSQKTMLPHCD